MRIEEVEGIGEGAGGTLRAAGIATTDDLLMAAASAAGRTRSRRRPASASISS